MLAFRNRIVGLVNRRWSISVSNGARRVFCDLRHFDDFHCENTKIPQNRKGHAARELAPRSTTEELRARAYGS